MVWHGSPPNKTNQKRRAIAVHYMPDHTVYVPTGSHPIEPFITVKPGEKIAGENFPIVFEGLGGVEWAKERARKLLGWNYFRHSLARSLNPALSSQELVMTRRRAPLALALVSNGVQC
jgi:hypothetical protein